MKTTLLIRDEEPSGKAIREFELELPSKKIDVRELIRSRVFQEVKDFNARQAIQFNGMVCCLLSYPSSISLAAVGRQVDF